MLTDEQLDHTYSLDSPPPLGDPRPVLARRGDLLIAHYLLGHNIGGNTSPATRRILYYRLRADGHEERWADTFLENPGTTCSGR